MDPQVAASSPEALCAWAKPPDVRHGSASGGFITGSAVRLG